MIIKLYHEIALVVACSVVLGPERMITVPPRHYCIIENPVVRDKDNDVVLDGSGQAKLSHADQEIRLAQEPFPLWPGELLKQPLTPLKVVVANTALRLKAVLDFETDDGDKRTAGDEWLFEGPGTCSCFIDEELNFDDCYYNRD